MKQNKWIRRLAITVVMALPVLTAGCGIFGKGGKEIDPPQVELEEGQSSLLPGTGQEAEQTVGAGVDNNAEQATEGAEMLTVYLQDRNGYLAPVSLSATLAPEEDAGQRVLEMMVDGGTYSNLLPEDFRAMLPQGTQVIDYKIDEATQIAKVDFSESFTQYSAQDERAILESITWALTSLPGINGVELYHEGSRLAEMPENAFPLDQALTRDMGINLELANGANYMNSYPVTLYFSALTYYDEQYFVPVTRLINRSDSSVHAALEELIAGPANVKQLKSEIWPNIEVLSIDEKDGIVTVDLQDSTYEEGQKLSSGMLQAVILSVTENTKAESVMLKINGQTNITDELGQVYSSPVQKQKAINAIKS